MTLGQLRALIRSIVLEDRRRLLIMPLGGSGFDPASLQEEIDALQALTAPLESPDVGAILVGYPISYGPDVTQFEQVGATGADGDVLSLATIPNPATGGPSTIRVPLWITGPQVGPGGLTPLYPTAPVRQRVAFATSSGPGAPQNIGSANWSRTTTGFGSGTRQVSVGGYMSALTGAAGGWVGWACNLTGDVWAPCVLDAIIGTEGPVGASRIIGIVATVDATPVSSVWWTGPAPTTKGMGILSYSGGNWQVVTCDGANSQTVDTGIAVSVAANTTYLPKIWQTWDSVVHWEVWQVTTTGTAPALPVLLGSGQVTGTSIPDIAATGAGANNVYVSVGAMSGGLVAEKVQLNNAHAAVIPPEGVWT